MAHTPPSLALFEPSIQEPSLHQEASFGGCQEGMAHSPPSLSLFEPSLQEPSLHQEASFGGCQEGMAHSPPPLSVTLFQPPLNNNKINI
jgi:hypothetical protein